MAIAWVWCPCCSGYTCGSRGGTPGARLPKSRRAWVTKSIRMHHLALLLSKFSLQVKTLYQIATECTIYPP